MQLLCYWFVGKRLSAVSYQGSEISIRINPFANDTEEDDPMDYFEEFRLVFNPVHVQ